MATATRPTLVLFALVALGTGCKPEVHVDPPQVTVGAPVVNVPPPQINLSLIGGGSGGSGTGRAAIRPSSFGPASVPVTVYNLPEHVQSIPVTVDPEVQRAQETEVREKIQSVFPNLSGYYSPPPVSTLHTALPTIRTASRTRTQRSASLNSGSVQRGPATITESVVPVDTGGSSR